LGRGWNHVLALFKDAGLDAAVFKAAGFDSSPCAAVASASAVKAAGAGFLWALVDQDGLFLHDRLSGTRIVKCS
jgi:hypothetical protein